MTGKHTPGPWLAHCFKNEWSVRDVDDEIVATVAEWSMDLDQADARLIAAAPDLAEALVEIIQDAEVCINIPASAYAALRKAGVIE